LLRGSTWWHNTLNNEQAAQRMWQGIDRWQEAQPVALLDQQDATCYS